MDKYIEIAARGAAEYMNEQSKDGLLARSVDELEQDPEVLAEAREWVLDILEDALGFQFDQLLRSLSGKSFLLGLDGAFRMVHTKAVKDARWKVFQEETARNFNLLSNHWRELRKRKEGRKEKKYRLVQRPVSDTEGFFYVEVLRDYGWYQKGVFHYDETSSLERHRLKAKKAEAVTALDELVSGPPPEPKKTVIKTVSLRGGNLCIEGRELELLKANEAE